MLRDISLRPGLNIVWSPDPADRGSQSGEESPFGPGHGAGKTLVCRLLRYCLGEPHFAPEAQRAKIAGAFREGRVGAELVLDGVSWAVVRSIGVMPFDVVRENATLEATIADEVATGVSPLIEAITERIMTSDVSEMIAANTERAWLAAVEWLARDQECRFGKVTEWRNSSSDSGSPKLSAGRATNIVRALIGAITPREHKLEAELQELDGTRALAVRDVERNQWGISRSVTRITKALELDVGDLPAEGLVVGRLRTAARDKIARISVVNAQGEMASLEDLETQHEEARIQVQGLERDMAAANGKRETAETLSKMIERETPGIAASLDEAEMPSCPICEVPINRALAEGCKLSHKLRDLSTLRQRREENERDLRKCLADAEDAKAKASAIVPKLEAAKATVTAAWKEVIAGRRLRKERSDAWYAARRVGDDIAELETLLEAKVRTEAEVTSLDSTIKQTREAATNEREQHTHVFTRLAQHFDALVRGLLGEEASGRVHHDGNGLHLTVEYGGDRSTPAIDTVKILAFDLAAMCRSIEGATHVPALLIHDSPREADLGLSHYHQLFRLIVELERVGSAPLFQYIVTTTTRPPEDLAVTPWLCLKLHGAPAKDRLLGRDL